MYMLLYVYLISHILLVLCNYTLVPSQVLLPKTSFYRCRNNNLLLTVNVQFVLKIEPSLCVNWKLQNSQVLLFDKSNYTALQRTRVLEDNQEYENYNEDELKGCSSSVILTTVPLNFKDDTINNFTQNLVDSFDENGNKLQLKTLQNLKDNSDVKTFVFAYDSNFRFHAVAEVVISKLEKLTVETAYRKVSKNQTFTLKLRGLDREGNTFSSLEGLPFYLLFEGPRIFEIQEIHEGELYSEKRANVLSQVENFALPEGTTLVTDLVMFKGVKVGRATLKFGLFLDEYSQVMSAPVEFVVNDSVVLSHQNLYMLDNTSFQLKLQYPTSGQMYPNGNSDEVNLKNYEWSTDADETKVTLNQKGLVQVHVFSSASENKDKDSGDDNERSEDGGEEADGQQKNMSQKSYENEYKCVVYVKDLRTNELLKSYVSVMRPYSLMLKYNSLQGVNNCLLSKSLALSKDSQLFSTEEGLDKYLDKLVELNNQEGEECYNYEFKQKENVVYLFENNYYLFKFNLMTYNKNLFNTFDSSLLKFTYSKTTDDNTYNKDTTSNNNKDNTKEEKELVKLVRHKQNYYVYKAMKLGCGYYDLSYGLDMKDGGSNEDNTDNKDTTSNKDNKLVHKYKVCVLEQVRLPGYDSNEKLRLAGNYGYSVCEKPLVVSVGDVFELSPKGGSGKYKYELDGCYNEGNKFVCSEKGSYQLKVVDANNEENGLVLQLVATTVGSSRFSCLEAEGLKLEENKSEQLLGKDNKRKGKEKYKDNTNKDKKEKKQRRKEEQEMNVRLNKGMKVRLRLYGDLSGYKPMFKEKFTEEDSELYAFNYFLGEVSSLVATVNEQDRLEAVYRRPSSEGTENKENKEENTYNKDTTSNKDNKDRRGDAVGSLKLLLYDRNVLELEEYEKDSGSGLVVAFRAVSLNSTKLEVNTSLLVSMYNKELGRDGDKLYLNESEFRKLMVNVYKDPELYVNEKYQLPIINLGYNKDSELLANLALGVKVELNYKFGLKGSEPKLSNKSKNDVLYVEELKDKGKGFMVYCTKVGQEELLFELLDYSRVYKVTCGLPKYNRVYPLNKLSSELYELVDQKDSGHLGLQGLGGEQTKVTRYMVNKSKTNRYVNLLYDENDNLLLTSNLYESRFHLYVVDSETSSKKEKRWSKKDTTSSQEKLVKMTSKDGNIFEFNLDEDKDTSSSNKDTTSSNNKDNKSEQLLGKDNKENKEFKVEGCYRYNSASSNYYSDSVAAYKLEKLPMLVARGLKGNNWKFKGKHYVVSNQVYLVPKNNHKLLLEVEEKMGDGDERASRREKEKGEHNAYVMYNKLFVYKLYVYGGSGRYSLTTSANDFKYTFSSYYSFPGHLSRVDKEKMVERDFERDEMLPFNSSDRKEVVVNLFDYGNLKDAGRFLTFATNNVNDLVLNLKDEGLLWQDTVHLKLHFRNPNRFELVVTPFEVGSGDSRVVSVKEDKEELLYFEDRYRLKLEAYYNENRFINNSLLLAYKLLNQNLGLKSLNESKVNLDNLQGDLEYEGYYNENSNTQLFFKGGDELVLNTFGLGSSGFVVSGLDGSLKRTYRFKVINKLLLNYNNVTVLPDTHFDVTFKNLTNYSNLKVTTSRLGSEGTENKQYTENKKNKTKEDKEKEEYERYVHNYSLGFKELGMYKYNVNVMYNNNKLTQLEQRLVVNVSKPSRMGFHVSSLDSTHSTVLGLSDSDVKDTTSNKENKDNQTNANKENKEQNKNEQVVDDNLFEYVVDRDAVVNLNVLLFDQLNNMFTPLYLKNNNLDFKYQLSEHCRVVGYGNKYQFHSGLGLGSFVGSKNFDSKSEKDVGDLDDQENLKETRNEFGGLERQRMEPQNDSNYNRYRSDVVVTNKYNVLLSVSNNCDVVVTSMYNGVSLQSKKLRFKVKVADKLFVDQESSSPSLFKEGVGFGNDNVLYVEELEDNTDSGSYEYGRGRGFGQCRDDDENLCFGGVYEVKMAFRSYPDNKLKELGDNLYKVTNLGSVMLTTETNAYNVKLLKPTHFSLVQLNYDEFGNRGLYYDNYSRSGYQSSREVDFVTYNMKKLVFKVVLFSNHRKVKMPRNGAFSVRMKDLSVFSYELEGDVLTLSPQRVGQTVFELVYSLNRTSEKETTSNNNKDNKGNLEEDKELKLLYQDEYRLNRVYFVRSGRYELTNVYNVMLGSQVYLTGSRVNGVVVNLDANSYEFQKFLKNKYTVKTYGTSCFGFECGVTYVNKNDYVNDVNKLKHLVNLNRTSYKVLLNVVTNALNTLFNFSLDYFDYKNVDREFGDVNETQNLYERKKLFNMSNLTEKYKCRNNYCWLQLNYTLKNPVSLNQVNQANQMLYNYYNNNYYGSGRDLEDLEEVMRMLSSPLLGVDNTMWNSEEGAVKDMKVNSDNLGTHKFKNVNNEQVVTNVLRFDHTHYKFRQLDPSTLVLLPNYPSTDKKQVTAEQLVRELDLGVFGNHGNVLYYDYGLNYHFKDLQLNKLYFLKLTYTPHLVHDTDHDTSSNKDTTSNNNKDNKEQNKNKTKEDLEREEYERKGRLVYRLGYKMLLVNSSNKEWSVLKNHLRTMSADLLKGKHKLNLQLYYSYRGDKDNQTNANKENRKELLEQELEVELPESVVFVDSEGHLVNELNESSMNHVLHVYPVSSSHKLHLTSNNYVVKTVERSGQLATFILYSNESANDTTPANNNKLLFSLNKSTEGTFDEKDKQKEDKFVGNNYLMVLNSSNHVVGKIKISADLSASAFSLAKFNFFSNRSLSDVLLLALTLVVVVFFFFVYNTLRNHHYYQPTVPIKLERTLPKAFDHLQQTRYHYRYHPH